MTVATRILAAFLYLSLAAAPPSWAHGDEDHSHASGAEHSQPTVGKRLPDGTLFIPKATQQKLAFQTRTAKAEPLALTLTFNGKVIADPNASGRVQAIQPGRIESGRSGLPNLGQRVRKGEILAWLQPSVSSIERGNQQALLAELDARLAIAERHSSRLEEFDAAEFELKALKQRRAVIGASLAKAEPLHAPVSGVISATHVVVGQVVEAREILFEIIDPARLAVEAMAYTALPGTLIQASAQSPGGSHALQFIGASRQLRGQAMPLLFRVKSVNADTGLAVGQPVKVFAQTRQKATGIVLPESALSKNAAGETVVWLHIEADRFVPRVVKAAPLAAGIVMINAGLRDGDIVVIEGAGVLAKLP
jgi:membrane fusion protein, heavy metal efflux system